MLFYQLLAVTALAAVASAKHLYVSSYSGNVTTLSLTKTTHANSSSGSTYKLVTLSSNNACAPNASFLTIDPIHQNLFCVNEGIVNPNGSLVSFKISPNSGRLTKINSVITPAAPVNSALYTTHHNGTSKQLLAVAHYAWGLTTYTVDPSTANFTLSQAFNFTLAKPGPNAARQAAPHPHQVLLDPTKNFFLVPDLGADLVRVFHIDPSTLHLTPRASIPVIPGSGPRHGVFQTVRTNGTETHYFFLVTELANTITSYQVTYQPFAAGLLFRPITTLKTYGNHTEPIFAGNAAAEIALICDKELLVSNRNATYFGIANPDPRNATKVASDTLASFKIGEAGEFSFGGLSPAGGSFPRQFSVSPAEDLVAVGLQDSARVVVYGVDGKKGRVGRVVLASAGVEGGVTSVVWGE
ncbi:MAG: hypothetical protein Q9195_007155 [Heterodermia aff. obscurata]